MEASRASLSPYGPIDLLYLHAPDAATEIELSLAELKAMHDEGAFVNLGLSNFPAWEVAYIHGKCEDIGLPPPTTYQGMYNCVTRAVEPELLPALRALDMRFLAYNPLAGGLLTGKHEAGGGGDADKNASSSRRGRFSENKMYLDRFWRPEYFAAVDAIAAACGKHEGLTVADASLLIRDLELGGKGKPDEAERVDVVYEDGHEPITYTGVLQRFEPVDGATQTVKAVVEVENAAGRAPLSPNVFCRVTLRGAQEEQGPVDGGVHPHRCARGRAVDRHHHGIRQPDPRPVPRVEPADERAGCHAEHWPSE